MPSQRAVFSPGCSIFSCQMQRDKYGAAGKMRQAALGEQELVPEEGAVRFAGSSVHQGRASNKAGSLEFFSN